MAVARQHGGWVRWIGSIVVAGLAALMPLVAAAHPLGNFTINRYTRIEPGANQIGLFYIIDMAEIPTLQERQRMDVNGDGTLDSSEQGTWREALATTLVGNLTLAVDGTLQSLLVDNAALSFPVGQGGLETMRFELRVHAANVTNANERSVSFRDNNYADRLGWSEVIVRGAGATVSGADVPDHDMSNELHSYPADMLQRPSSVNAANFRFVPSAGATYPQNPSPISTGYPQAAQTDQFVTLITAPLTSPSGLLLALAAAFGLGAAHALAPGHGKTIVAAYLVGTRGTPWHALLLGLSTTATHTIGVFALGLITLFISRFILPERLYPWLGVISGLLVVVIGIGLLRSRLIAVFQRPTAANAEHDGSVLHSHGFGVTHTHVPVRGDTASDRSTMRRLLLLGVSGGLIPCPSALVVLLGAVALGRVGFGLLLVLVFSFGLATVLTLVGVALVYARRVFDIVPVRHRLFRLLPVGSALVVLGFGGAMTAQAVFSLIH